MSGTITVKPGETVMVVGVPADPLQIWGGGNERFPTNPIAGPGRGPGWGMAQDPGYGIPEGPTSGSGPVDPGYSPPWATIPEGADKGTWVWAYSPQTKRWMWVRVPGEGEAGPK